MTQPSGGARLAVDIGGTFTDLALEVGEEIHASKVLTTTTAPEEGVMRGIAELLVHGSYRSLDLGLFDFARFAEGRLIHERNIF